MKASNMTGFLLMRDMIFAGNMSMCPGYATSIMSKSFLMAFFISVKNLVFMLFWLLHSRISTLFSLRPFIRTLFLA